MLENSKVHFSADSKDLTCPICYSPFGQEANHPIATNCGHAVCSLCFDKISKCPFCQARFDKRQKYQKSVLISSLLKGSAKINTCKKHAEVYQGFCLKDQVLVCFECLMKNHQGHKIISIKEIGNKAEKIKTVFQKAQNKKESKLFNLENSLESEKKRRKRQLEEIIDQEILHLSLLKKKLFKEIDIQTTSDKEHYKQKLLSENLSKYCQSTEKMLESWKKSQEEDLAVKILEAPLEEDSQDSRSFRKRVDFYISDIPKKHAQSSNEILKNLNHILSHPSAKLKALLSQKNNSISPFPQIELQYFIAILQEYNFSVSHKNGIFELKLKDPLAFTPKFDPSHITCSLSKISLACDETLPFQNLHTICQILENIDNLKDVTLQLQKIESPDILVLSHLISHIKALEKFSVQVDLADVSNISLSKFMVELTRIENLSSLKIQNKTPHTIISLQLNPSAVFEKLFESLQEISLDLAARPEILCLSLDPVNFSNAKYLKRFTITLGNTTCSPQVFDAVSKTLRFQSEIEDLTFVCEELSDSTSAELMMFLRESTQRKKLSVFINKISLGRETQLDIFLPESNYAPHDFEEFTLKMKCNGRSFPWERFERLIGFLSASKALKKLCLQFDNHYCRYDSIEKLLRKIVRLEALTSLEIEFLNSPWTSSERNREMEAILNQLPSSVTKKCVFSESPPVNDDEEGSPSSPSEYDLYGDYM